MPKFTLLSREESGKESCHWSVMCRLSLSVCISVSQKRRDNSGCQCFNLRLVMMKSGHTTQIFCFLSIPIDFQLQISLFIFVFFCFSVFIFLRILVFFWVCLDLHLKNFSFLIVFFRDSYGFGSLSEVLIGADLWTHEFSFHKIQNSLENSLLWSKSSKASTSWPEKMYFHF